MVNCFACGKPFDNEIWYVDGNTAEDSRVTVISNRKCPECWEKDRRESGCRITSSDEHLSGPGYTILRCG